MRAPMSVRWPTQAEWNIVSDVFKDTLPFRQRVFMTDALGGGNAPFTIPTSTISATTIPALISSGLQAVVAANTGPVGRALGALINVTGYSGIFAWPAQLQSLFSIGYLMNVGPAAYPDMTASQQLRELLVHEMTHVWQGKNSTFAITYVINSFFHQCQGMAGGGSRGAAYAYTPGQWFRSYNAEQQAKIVEDWYSAGMPQSGALWPYIRDHVRTGNA